MEKSLSIMFIVLAFVIGVLVGVLAIPPLGSSATNSFSSNVKSVKESVENNMRNFQVAAEIFRVDSGYYPKNSDISWASEYLLGNFKNPVNGKEGPDFAYMSGTAKKAGIVGYESDRNGYKYVITGHGVNGLLNQTLKPRKIPDWKIVNIKSDITEANDIWWKFVWWLTIKNNSNEAITLNAKIKFVDENGNLLHDSYQNKLHLKPREEKTFNGYEVIDDDIAANVASVTADVWLR